MYGLNKDSTEIPDYGDVCCSGWGTDYSSIPLDDITYYYNINRYNYYGIAVTAYMECMLSDGTLYRTIIPDGEIDVEFELFEYPLIGQSLTIDSISLDFISSEEVRMSDGNNTEVLCTWEKIHQSSYDRIQIIYSGSCVYNFAYDYVENTILDIPELNDVYRFK